MTYKAEDFLVSSELAEMFPAYAQFDGLMYAGLLPIDHDQRIGQLMFWMFVPHKPEAPDTWALWLNGGPGCSSFGAGVMMENAPITHPLHTTGYCCIEEEPTLLYNPYAWTNVTTMLYVEQPIGTGFSYGHPLPENQHEAASDLYVFLQHVVHVFGLEDQRLFLTGESYAGMYLPSIAHYIHHQNLDILAAARHNQHRNAKTGNHKVIPMGGVVMGNGWMDAKVQGPAVIDYAWWHGLIDQPTRNALHRVWPACQTSDDTALPPPFHPFNVPDDCGMMWGVLEAAGQLNAYEISTWQDNVDVISDSASEYFYNVPRVKKLLHAPHNITWQECVPGSGRRRRLNTGQRRSGELARLLSYMENDRPLSVIPYVEELLDTGLSFLIYNGDMDLTTNMVGTELLLNGMNWSGREAWVDAPRGVWLVDDSPAGWAKSYDTLTFVVVYNSGHIVPYNQPHHALDMFHRFVMGESLIDVSKPLVRYPLDFRESADSLQVPWMAMMTSMNGTSSNTDIVAYNSRPLSPMESGVMMSWWALIGVVALSFLLGGIVCPVVMQTFLSRRYRRLGYDTITQSANSQESF